MSGMQNRLGLYLMGVIAACAFSAWSSAETVHAGNINSNEASVISAASGTFSYNGKTYQAYSNYISSLSVYLSDDDIDLTAEQANEAIATMYASIGDGVAEGYLYEVSVDSGLDESGSEAGTESEKTREKSKKKKEKQQSGQSEDGRKDQPESASEGQSGAENTDESEMQIAVQPETQTKDVERQEEFERLLQEDSSLGEKLQDRPERGNASAIMEQDEDELLITGKGGKVVRISKERPFSAQELMNKLKYVSFFFAIVTFGCGIFLFATGCIRLKRRDRQKNIPGHRKRRKIRLYTEKILAVTTAVSFFGCFLMIGLYISLFNKGAIMENMQKSGYFRHAYTEYVTDMAVARLLKTGKEDEPVYSYEEYLFREKEASMKVLDGDREAQVSDGNVTSYIYHLKMEYMRFCRGGGVLLICTAIVGILLLLFMNRRRKRGILHIALAWVAAGLAVAALAVTVMISRPYRSLYVEPDYLYLFVMETIKWSTKVIASIAAFGVGVGIVLLGVYHSIRD